MKMKSMALAAALAAGAGVCAQASPLQQPPVLMTDDELAEQRGGLQTPFGYEVGFGATVRTYVDGALTLETTLTWGEGGVVVGGGSAGEGPVWTAYVPAATGGTEVRHVMSADRIASVVINTANGRDVRQETDISLVIPQLAQLQEQAQAARTAEGLQQALAAALTDAVQ